MSAPDTHAPLAPDAARPRDAAGADGVELITFGCRLNAYESEVIRAHAEAAGRARLVVVNTCAVTAEAVRQARQAVRRARREHPGARVVVTGCAAQIDPDMFAGMAEVDEVVGNHEKLLAPTWAAPGETRVRVNDIFATRETAGHLIEGFGGRARAYVQVQNGCDHRCTFCVIPYGRGAARSVPAGEVVGQIARLADEGFAEVVLSGVDITSWGADLPGAPSLGVLVRRILAGVPSLQRLRLSSIDAVEIDDTLFALIAEDERIAPHLHLSLQAGDDLILKRMKRRHLRADAVALCARLRQARPDIALGADLIAGFPTETEAMFENTLALVDECGLAYLHVFPFSARPQTPAARMPQTPSADIKDRARRLRAAGEAALARHLDAQLGSTQTVLVERAGFGRLANFAPVRFDPIRFDPARFDPEDAREGAMLAMRLVSHDGASLSGERADEAP